MTIMRTVREIKEADINLILDYFLDATPEFLKGLGVDMNKLPQRDTWHKLLDNELLKPVEEKQMYFIIWELDGKPIGHSNINKIKFGEEAFMHLHLWKPDNRVKGNGSWFVTETIPYYFKNFRLKTLFCEPNAFNTAPNKTLEKVGFIFVKEYITTPGYLNFEQPVKLWKHRGV